MHVWLITVNYGDPAPTASLLESLQACQKNTLTIQMGIADNASQSSNYNKLNKLKTDSDIEIELFPFSINFFYWPAANQVINKIIIAPTMVKSVIRPLNAVKMLVETPIAITEGS